MADYTYQVGGSLARTAVSYVQRQADIEFFNALKKGEFCYVLDSRQMGKSSLLVRARYLLEQEGILCATLDMTNIGSENITPIQWYKGIITELCLALNLFDRFDLQAWWQTQEDLSLLHRLSNFIAEVLLNRFPNEQLLILIDEVDGIRSLSFSVDDFFALIRHCYNQRAIDPAYNRLTFAIAGVATPSDLIADPKRTPFNIGQAIKLQGFQFNEAIALLQGLALKSGEPHAVLQAVLRWTNGQPFLTQKLFQMLAQTQLIPLGHEALWVDDVVRSQILQEWETQDHPEHLRTIRNQLLENPQYSGSMLALYQQLLRGEQIPLDDTPVQTELLLTGLVTQDSGFLQVKNQIYAQAFDLGWVEQQLTLLRPYSQAFKDWIASNQQDESRLLRGQALLDAQRWATGKSLSDRDYQFLVASQKLEWQEEELVLRAERASAIALQLSQQQTHNRRQKRLIGLLITALVTVIGLSISLHAHGRSILLNQIKTITTTTQLLFASNRYLDALIAGIQAKRQLQNFGDDNPALSEQVNAVLRQSVLGASEANRLVGHQGAVKGVAFSPDGKLIASASGDRTVKLWQRNGKLLHTFIGHTSLVWEVAFSTDGKTIVSGSMDGTVRLWDLNGKLLKTIVAHPAGILGIATSKNFILSASTDKTIKLWDWDGKLLHLFTGHTGPVWDVVMSHDEQLIVSGSEDHTVKLWDRKGTLLATLLGHNSPLRTVVINPQGTIIATSGADNRIKLWTRNGNLLHTLYGHKDEIWGLSFSPDGRVLATAGNDQAIKFWTMDGTLLETFQGYGDWINNMAFSPDGELVASADQDKTVKLWRWRTPLLNSFSGQGTVVLGVALSPDGRAIASAHEDGSVDLWTAEGEMLKQLNNPNRHPNNQQNSNPNNQQTNPPIRNSIHHSTSHPTSHPSSHPTNHSTSHPISHSNGNFIGYPINHSTRNPSKAAKPALGIAWAVAFSPNGKLIASTHSDATVRLWTADGVFLKTLKGHQAEVWGVAFSPDGNLIASGSMDNIVNLFRVSDGAQLIRLKGHLSRVKGVAFSANGQVVASASEDATIKLWNVRDGSLITTLRDHHSSVWDVTFSPDGKLLASGSEDNTVNLWDASHGRLIRTLKGHRGPVWSVAFSADSQLLASGSVDRTVKLWRTVDGSPVTTLYRHREKVNSVAFRRDGQAIVSASSDSAIIVWDLRQILAFNPLEFGCDWVRDYLQTNAEAQATEQSHLCQR
jgi:WD40 repeat protein